MGPFTCTHGLYAKDQGEKKKKNLLNQKIKYNPYKHLQLSLESHHVPMTSCHNESIYKKGWINFILPKIKIKNEDIK